MIDYDIYVELIEKGFTLSKISKELNIPYISVRRSLSKYGLKTKSKNFKYEVIECDQCSVRFKVNKKHNRKFCSRLCSVNSIKENTSPEKRIDINSKISSSMIKRDVNGICKWCEKEFIKRSKSTEFCSRSCSSKERSNRKEIKEKTRKFFSDLAKKRYSEGDNSIGWKSRDKMVPSYPEKLTIDFLDGKNIPYTREFKISKYFIDFAFIERKIALEIDGRTHNDSEIIIKDLKRDEYLKSIGWKIHRIKWVNDNNHFDKLNDFAVKWLGINGGMV